ncbi:GIY-YIG nuclease family protein [Paenirhodobacter sp. CAU 1674]|uniref:GIY-YIG nuclease family protein n=1 Tax=Paenirhodobacter sp. CAU 1674 TaxID=3032596 RepID=UPI0023DCA884|nr:GIY-YIG nuclease family protein [Paenirhodobacter sp. CAU 1674]MDF2142124.1 GIY-YIG nuclease family protein [Paenirhodobacter sp. CAU 1674]
MAQGRSLELFFVDGNPSGMQTAEVFNWTGHVLYFPRTQIVQALARPAARHTGVYVLLGADEAGPRAYVGEGEDIAARIRSHDVAKDFWTHAALITTQANNLHKAHVKYLESRLIEDARRIGRMPLDNANTPARPGLSEAARANMEEFLETLFIVLPALRIDMFEERARPVVMDALRQVVDSTPSEKGAEFHLSAPRVGIEAVATLVDGDFVVEAGARARGAWAGVDYATYRPLYDELRSTGVLVSDGEGCRFAERYAFASPSAAASVILGRASNGATKWKTPEGKTYKEWEATMLAALPQEE